jgi:hypothetical protein
MFRFTELSNTERILRLIRNNADTDAIASPNSPPFWQTIFSLITHKNASMGVFFFLSFTPQR